MNTQQYFKTARSLGAFTAEDCISLAREAAELDRIAEIKKLSKPVVVWNERMPDGSGLLKFSNGITVY